LDSVSRAPAEEYNSLRPIGSPLPALSTKYGSSALELRRSNRAAMVPFCWTDRTPLSAFAFVVYRSLVKMTLPLAAFRLN
jgi:hypothetical protein